MYKKSAYNFLQSLSVEIYKTDTNLSLVCEDILINILNSD